MKRVGFHFGLVIVGVGALAVFSCIGLARFAYSMILPYMSESLSLNFSRMGLISTGNFAGYIFAVAMVPFVVKVWGSRAAITAGLVLIGVTMFALAGAVGFFSAMVA